jgi:hypothetical protein
MFNVIHMDASSDNDPPLESLSDLYDELYSSGIMDGDVSVAHDDSGWCISAHRDGRVVFGHLGDPSTDRHMIPVPKERVLDLWKRLIAGDIEGLLMEPWKPGYVENV